MSVATVRPSLEVADIVRAYASAYRARHPLSPQQARVLLSPPAARLRWVAMWTLARAAATDRSPTIPVRALPVGFACRRAPSRSRCGGGDLPLSAPRRATAGHRLRGRSVPP